MTLPLVLLIAGVALVALSVAPTLKARRRMTLPPSAGPAAGLPVEPPRSAVQAEPPKPAPPHPSPEDVGSLLDDLLGTGLAQPAAPAPQNDPPAIEDPRRVAEVLRIWLRDR